jgi:hypothetical protein
MIPRKTASRTMFNACALAMLKSLPNPWGNRPDRRNKVTARISAATGGEIDIGLTIGSFETG